MGNKIVLKKDVVPHKNLQGISSPVHQSQLTESAKKRKQKHQLEFYGSHKKVTRNLFFENEEGESLVMPSTSSVTPTKPTKLDIVVSPSGKFSVQSVHTSFADKGIQVQSVHTSFADKGIQVNIKPKGASVGVSANIPTPSKLTKVAAQT